MFAKLIVGLKNRLINWLLRTSNVKKIVFGAPFLNTWVVEKNDQLD